MPSDAKIGIVSAKDESIARAIVAGARRALDEARAEGGPDLAVVVADAPAAWGSVASETVRLACEEHVVAVIGPPDRDLAHPVAQAATRCRVPMVSTSSAGSVTAAGTRWVVSVAAAGATPEQEGYDAARVIADAVRRVGLRRDAVLAAMTDGTAVTGSAGAFRFGAFGRRESAAK
jgi:ABC-type branched-subunit amino acid transport system substrate-binding protein